MINDNAARKWKCGEAHPTKPGMVFWRRTSWGGEWWVPLEKYEALKKEARERAAQKRLDPAARAEEARRSHERNVKHGYCRQYYAKNKERIKEYSSKWRKMRRKLNPQYPMAEFLRQTIRRGINGTYTDSYLLEWVGCTRQTLCDHLRSQLKAGMVWEERKTWHVDHIIPLSSFDLTCPEQRKKANHYTNLQVLTPSENSIKGTKIVDTVFVSVKGADA